MKNRKLTYWCAPVKGDRRAYNVRARTRSACYALLTRYAKDDPEAWRENYGKPEKVTIEWVGGIHELLFNVLGEGGPGEPEASAD